MAYLGVSPPVYSLPIGLLRFSITSTILNYAVNYDFVAELLKPEKR